MAVLNFRHARISSDAVVPRIRISFEYEMPQGEVIMGIDGILRVQSGLEIGRLQKKFQSHNNRDYMVNRFHINQNHFDSKITKEYFDLQVDLSRMAIEHIETVRAANHEKSAVFGGEIEFTTILNIYDDGKTPSNLCLRTRTENFQFVIAQSDWVNKYAPALGIGKYLLVELKLLENTKVSEAWRESFDRTQLRLQEMEARMRSGDWQAAITKGRQVFENLKMFGSGKEDKKMLDDFKEALEAANHTEKAIEQLEIGIKAIFNYASKHLHDKSTSGEINPLAVWSKEDAYLIYSLGLSLLNLIGSKLEAAGRE